MANGYYYYYTSFLYEISLQAAVWDCVIRVQQHVANYNDDEEILQLVQCAGSIISLVEMVKLIKL